MIKNYGLTKWYSNSLENNIAGIALAIAVLLPHTGLLYLANPLLLFLLWYYYSSKQSVYELRGLKIILVSFIGLSFIWNLFYGIPINSKSIIRAVYIVELILLFPFINNLKFRNIYLYFITSIILLSQLAYLFNIGIIMDFINTFYPYTGDNISETADFISERSTDAQSLSELQRIRFGGLFHNSNQCMKYISLCGVVYIIENYTRSIWVQLPFWGIIGASAILSGSRTGFVIIFIAFFFMLIIRSRIHLSVAKIIIYLLLMYAVFFFLSSIFASDFRMFDLSSGAEEDGSIGIKVEHFEYYNNLVYEIRQTVVGNFDIDSIVAVYHTPFSQFDSEWGNAVYFYGYLFLIVYFIYLITIFSRLRGINILAILLFFWVISSTVLFSFRTSFAYFLILSKCYTNSIALKDGRDSIKFQ